MKRHRRCLLPRKKGASPQQKRERCWNSISTYGVALRSIVGDTRLPSQLVNSAVGSAVGVLPTHVQLAESDELRETIAEGGRALRLSEIKPGQRLGLYGFGNSAHVVIQVAVKMDCRVYVFTRSLRHQKLAEELGAVWVGTAEEASPEPLDAAIIFAPRARLSRKHCERSTRGAPWLWPGSQ